jgi:hypothetical protein
MRIELTRFFERQIGSHQLAHVYFEPVMHGEDNYLNRELMTIESKAEIDRSRALRVPHPQNPDKMPHILVGDIAQAFEVFAVGKSAIFQSWAIQKISFLRITMILSASVGPVAILVGDSESCELTEDKQALMQARLIYAAGQSRQ